MPSVDCFSTMFQLYVAYVFFTNGACMMTLNTVTTQILICWKVINVTKKTLHTFEKSYSKTHQTLKPPRPTTFSSLQSMDLDKH